MLFEFYCEYGADTAAASSSPERMGQQHHSSHPRSDSGSESGTSVYRSGLSMDAIAWDSLVHDCRLIVDPIKWLKPEDVSCHRATQPAVRPHASTQP